MKRLPLFLLCCFASLCGTAGSIAETTGENRPRELLLASMHYSDGLWDESAGLLRSPLPEEAGRHRTRESTWYALGLFLRNAPGDDARAVRIVETVLAHQLDAPGQRWDGTFRRFLDEPVPGPGAELWKDFDPNWRHFIGTTFALILTEFEAHLPDGLAARLETSIRRAVESELSQGRDEPYHTNIKLMHGFLWSWAGARLNRPEWVAGGERWAEEVAAAFAVHETFEEYNSPTYYGVDFYGLALMRRHGATARIRELGAQLEAGLWHDVARFYHAGLRNMAGPYDRAYGMDMRRYVSLTGAWMGLVLPADETPLPDPSGPMGHAHDFLCTPTYVALGAQVPAEVMEHFRAFQGERVIRRPITAKRTATAWLAPEVMIGGEITGGTWGATPGKGQFHPATIHWRTPGNDVGWVRLYASPPSDAEAGKESLAITAPAAGDFTFRVSVPGLDVHSLTRERWTMPGLTLLIDTDAAFASTPGEGFVDVHYRGATRVKMGTVLPPRLVVVIAVDQCRADYLERFRLRFVEGGFRRLLAGGAVYANAHHRHAMTATAPGHATIMTGVHANVHGIVANEWFDLARGRATSAVEDPASPILGLPTANVRLPGGVLDTGLTASPRQLLAATVGDQVKLTRGDRARVISLANKDRGAIFMGGRKADAVYWMHEGRIVSSRYYQEALPAWVEAFNATNPINRRYGGTWDRLLPREIYDQMQGPDEATGEQARHGLGLVFPRKMDGGRPALDAEFHNAYRLDPDGSVVLGQLAQRAVIGEQLGRHDAPDLLCLGFSQLDYCGHSYGPDSHEIMDSVLRLDRVLAEFFMFLDTEVGAGRWTVVLTADHGVAPLPERSVALREAGLDGRLDWPGLTTRVEAALTEAFGAPANGASWTVRDSYGYRLIPATLAARGVDSSAAQKVVKAAVQRWPQVAFAWTRDELLDGALTTGDCLTACRTCHEHDVFKSKIRREDGRSISQAAKPALRAGKPPTSAGFLSAQRCFSPHFPATSVEAPRQALEDRRTKRLGCEKCGLAEWRLSFHRERSQDVILSPKPYVVDRVPTGTNHGTPYDYDSHIPLIWYGAGITPGVRIERIGSDAIAPTLAGLLAVPRPPEARAEPLF